MKVIEISESKIGEAMKSIEKMEEAIECLKDSLEEGLTGHRRGGSMRGRRDEDEEDYDDMYGYRRGGGRGMSGSRGGRY